MSLPRRIWRLRSLVDSLFGGLARWRYNLEAMISLEEGKEAFSAALPIVLGYVAIGIPCGILCDSIGLGPLEVLLMSCIFYSGAGQFMIPNLYLAGTPILSIIASVSFVNMRQMLYSASFAPYAKDASKPLAFLFAASVTDESYGVSIERFRKGGWTVERATLVNIFSCTSWTLSNVVGTLVGSLLGIPLTIASFAMTSIFICLMITQRLSVENVVAMVVAMLGVYVCKLVGLTGPAILVGAVLGVIAAFALYKARKATGKLGDSAREHGGEAPEGVTR